MTSIPAVPAKVDPQLRAFLSAVRESILKGSVAGGSGGGNTTIIQMASTSSASTTQAVKPETDDAVITLTLNDKAGTKYITLTAFKWSNTGMGSYAQPFVYDWLSGSVSAYPAGWSGSAGAAPGSGYTLYMITLNISEQGGVQFTNADWSGASSGTIGYMADGSIGPQGDSHRIAYIVTTSAVPPAVVAGTGDVLPTNVPAEQVSGKGWSATAYSSLATGEFMYQTDGIYETGGNVTWAGAYLSSLKVGSLSAISANLGTVGIASSGSLASAGKSYGNATAGVFLGWDTAAYKFDIGNNTNYLRWDGSNLTATGMVIKDTSGNIIMTSGVSANIDFGRIGGSTKPADNATVGAPAGTLVNGVAVETVTAAVTNFNASNDRNSAAITAPTILADGTAVDHTIQSNGSADISFEWAWSGNEGDIDGFIVYVYQSSSSAAYAFGTTVASETAYPVPANKRAFILFGVIPNQYYTFGVQAYRKVDKDINAAGIIKSSLVKPSLAAENPYQPSTSVAFTGNVTGTINSIPAGSINVWSSISGTGKPQDYATVGADGSNLNIALGGNLFPNSDFASPNVSKWMVGWVQGGGTNYSVSRDLAGYTWAPAGGHQIGFNRGGTTLAASGWMDLYYEDYFPVYAGGVFELSAYLAAHRCSAYINIGWYDASYVWMTENSLGPITNSGGMDLSAWGRAGALLTAPAGAVYARIWLRASACTAADPYAWITKIFFAKAKSGQTQLSPWQPAGNSGSFAELSQITASNATTYIANAAIGSAQIGNAAIGSAHIANASITTLKVAGGAITSPESVKVASVNINADNVAQIVAQLSPVVVDILVKRIVFITLSIGTSDSDPGYITLTLKKETLAVETWYFDISGRQNAGSHNMTFTVMTTFDSSANQSFVLYAEVTAVDGSGTHLWSNPPNLWVGVNMACFTGKR